MTYIYLLQRKVHFNTNIYKIGKTKDIKRRLNAADYRQCKIICIVLVSDCDEAEKELIKIFNKEFKQCVSLDPSYQGNEDYIIDDINKAMNIIFELSKNININETKTQQELIEVKSIDINEWWNQVDFNYNADEFSDYNKINSLFDMWIKFIDTWPFFYNKEKQLELSKYFEPIKFTKEGEIYFKIIRYNGTIKHCLFESLINSNKLKTSGLSKATKCYMDFIINISHSTNKSGNKLKYYDINNNEHETSAHEYFINYTTLKLFTKQILTKNDKNKIYVKYGIHNVDFMDKIRYKKSIINPILNELFMKYISIEKSSNIGLIIEIINDNLRELEIELLTPWLIHNNVKIDQEGNELEIYINNNTIILHLDCNNEISNKIENIIKKIKPSILNI